MPHEIHEAPLNYLVQRLSSVLQGIPFGQDDGSLNIQTLSNSQIHGVVFDTIPDLLVRMSYTPPIPHLVASHNCFALECAFTQSNADVMRKLKAYVSDFPDIVAVSKIVIKETPYTTPKDQTGIVGVQPITVKEWLSRKNKRTAMGPVTHQGITFVNITAINVYVWVRTATDPINVAELSTGTQVFAQGVSTFLYTYHLVDTTLARHSIRLWTWERSMKRWS